MLNKRWLLGVMAGILVFGSVSPNGRVFAADSNDEMVQDIEKNNTGFVIENGVLKEYNGTDSNVVIPDSVTEIGEYAFQFRNNVESIVIPQSVTCIHDKAFYFCEKLTSVTIPKSVTSIGNGVFMSCKNLKNIILDIDNQNYMIQDGV